MIRGIVTKIVRTQWVKPPAWLVDYVRRDLEREQASLEAEIAEARAAPVRNADRISKLEKLLAEAKSLRAAGL